MRFLWWGKRKQSEGNESVTDSKLSEAEHRLHDLECRSDRVTELLTQRLKRNHWGETVQEIAWKL